MSISSKKKRKRVTPPSSTGTHEESSKAGSKWSRRLQNQLGANHPEAQPQQSEFPSPKTSRLASSDTTLYDDKPSHDQPLTSPRDAGNPTKTGAANSSPVGQEQNRQVTPKLLPTPSTKGDRLMLRNASNAPIARAVLRYNDPMKCLVESKASKLRARGNRHPVVADKKERPVANDLGNQQTNTQSIQRDAQDDGSLSLPQSDEQDDPWKEYMQTEQEGSWTEYLQSEQEGPSTDDMQTVQEDSWTEDMQIEQTDQYMQSKEEMQTTPHAYSTLNSNTSKLGANSYKHESTMQKGAPNGDGAIAHSADNANYGSLTHDNIAFDTVADSGNDGSTTWQHYSKLHALKKDPVRFARLSNAVHHPKRRNKLMVFAEKWEVGKTREEGALILYDFYFDNAKS